jgi:hypothetical protein
MRCTSALITGSLTAGMLAFGGLLLQNVARSEAISWGAIDLQARSPHSSPQARGNSRMQLSSQGRSQLQPLTIDTMRLGGISLQFTESQVRAALGQPQTVDENDNPLIGAQERYLYYNKNGIHGIQLIKEKSSGQFVVFSVLANNVGAASQNGIQVKDSRKKLIKVLGQPSSIQNQGDDQEIWLYSSSDPITFYQSTLSWTLSIRRRSITGCTSSPVKPLVFLPYRWLQ